MNRKNPDLRPPRPLLAVLLALALALLPLPGRANEFVLLYSNDTHGEVDPCG